MVPVMMTEVYGATSLMITEMGGGASRNEGMWS